MSEAPARRAAHDSSRPIRILPRPRCPRTDHRSGGRAVLLPSAALGHAELDTVTPADKSTVQGSPDEIVMTFVQNLDPAKSSIVVVGASGGVVAQGGTVPAGKPREMDLPLATPLAPGGYTIRWTTTSTEDGETARGTTTFTVTAAPTPSPAPSVVPSAAPSIAPATTPSAVPTVAPSPVRRADDPGRVDERRAHPDRRRPDRPRRARGVAAPRPRPDAGAEMRHALVATLASSRSRRSSAGCSRPARRPPSATASRTRTRAGCRSSSTSRERRSRSGCRSPSC